REPPRDERQLGTLRGERSREPRKERDERSLPRPVEAAHLEDAAPDDDTRRALGDGAPREARPGLLEQESARPRRRKVEIGRLHGTQAAEPRARTLLAHARILLSAGIASIVVRRLMLGSVRGR